MKSAAPHWHRIGEVDDVRIELSRQLWQARIEPQVAAQYVIADGREVQVESRVGAWGGILNKFLLPRRSHQVKL
jgi:hypothetical protein